MNIYDIIFKKRNGQKLERTEIAYAINSYVKGEIPDYQMSALLMAIFIKGMTTQETNLFTKAMVESGDVMDLSGLPGIKVDKHSTGGVGDGISLVLAPLVASTGVIVPMMCGRSLGHTGGTLDKLESIPGFNVNLSFKRFKEQLGRIGVGIISPTNKVAPADRKIYALRDVTATVDTIPLIASSIMSKKIAEGCDALVLDVKTGSGAFMAKTRDAKVLARTMVNIGRFYKKKTVALITDMNQPLGNAVGNALEVKQAIDVLKGSSGPRDFIKLTVELGSRMLVLGQIEESISEAKKRLMKNLQSGRALDKFRQIVKAQGGDTRVIDSPERILPKAKYKKSIISPASGRIKRINTRSVGLASVLLGAGRIAKEDKIDHSAGIIVHKRLGDKVKKGEPIATFYYNDDKKLNEAIKLFIEAIKLMGSGLES